MTVVAVTMWTRSNDDLKWKQTDYWLICAYAVQLPPLLHRPLPTLVFDQNRRTLVIFFTSVNKEYQIQILVQDKPWLRLLTAFHIVRSHFFYFFTFRYYLTWTRSVPVWCHRICWNYPSSFPFPCLPNARWWTTWLKCLAATQVSNRLPKSGLNLTYTKPVLEMYHEILYLILIFFFF